MATGKELRNAIKGKGLTFEAAAKLLGISRQTLHTHMSKAEVDNDFIKNVKDKLDILLNESTNENRQGDIVSQLAKAVAHYAETIARNSRIMESQQETIKNYAERERATNINGRSKNGKPSKQSKKVNLVKL